MIHILTSTSTILKLEVRPQESRIGDSNVKTVLNLQLKKVLTKESFLEQQDYLQMSAIAAYVSLNKLDQRKRFRGSVNFIACNEKIFNFTQGSSSSGLGYALACFDAWWRISLNKRAKFNYPVFATGEILTSGQIKPIAQIHEKIESLCRYVEENKQTIPNFYFCYPLENDQEISAQLKDRIKNLGGALIASARLSEILEGLLGEDYDGDPLGRWLPFKGLKSFDYEDSFRFFGRDKDIERLYADIHHNNGLLIVSGASGTGKSSLIKAGLIPKLEKEYGRLYWATCTPNAASYSKGILRFVIEKLIDAWSIPCDQISDVIAFFDISIETGINFFNKHISENSQQCLLYLDQYEEVFNENEVNIYNLSKELGVLDSLAKSLLPLNIVLVIRSEYLQQLLDTRALDSPLISYIDSQLTTQEWLSVVREQAHFSGIIFEQNIEGQQSLDELIVLEAIKFPFALPMLSLLLEKLFSRAQEDNASTILLYKNYKELGGLPGMAIFKVLSVIEEYRPSDNLINKFFDYFIGITHDESAYAEEVSLRGIEKADTELHKLVNIFINANILVNTDSKTDKVRFVCNDLFTGWDLLHSWFIKHQSYLKWKNEITPNFNQWKAHINIYKDINTSKRYGPWHQFIQGTKALEVDSKKEDLELKTIELLAEGYDYFLEKKIYDDELKNYLILSLKTKSIFIGTWAFLFLLFIFLIG